MMMYSCPCIQKSKFTFNYGVRPFLAGHCVVSIVRRVFSQYGLVPGYRRSFVILLGGHLAKTRRTEGNIYGNELCVGRKKSVNSRERCGLGYSLNKISYFTAS